nr:hypothetical protein Iba_chr08dCG12130 [Ipomoea batatas]
MKQHPNTDTYSTPSTEGTPNPTPLSSPGSVLNLPSTMIL